VSTASASTLSTPTTLAPRNESLLCRRDNEIRSCTIIVSRLDSICMRPANRRTASGSSADPSTASASKANAPTGVFSGAGFAVPSNRVGAFVSRAVPMQAVPVALEQAGGATASTAAPASAPPRVWLGVGLVEVTPSIAAQSRLAGQRGLYVSSVVIDSPADEAEILRGDIITSVDGQPVGDLASLASILEPLTPGTTLAVEIWRGGKTERMSLRTRPGSAVRAR